MERRKSVKKSRRKNSPVRKSRRPRKSVGKSRHQIFLEHHPELANPKRKKSVSSRRRSTRGRTSRTRPFKIERSNKYWRDSKGDLHPLYAHFIRKDYPATGRRHYVLWKKGRSPSSPTHHGKFYKS